MLAEAKLASFFNNAPEECGHSSRGLPVEFSHCISLGRAVLACPVANRGCLAGSLRAQRFGFSMKAAISNAPCHSAKRIESSNTRNAN
jgi:hypothetical protein